MPYTIKDVAKKMDMSAHVLRYYEKEGLLPDIHRSKGGIRYYTQEDLELLGLIRCLKKTDMKLSEIRAFIELTRKGPDTLRARCEILQAQRQVVLHRIEEMQETLEKVSHKLAHYTQLLHAHEKEEP